MSFPRATFPCSNLRFWILWNWFELIWKFWAIALGSTTTFLQSDIGPSSLCLIHGSDKYNSVLFFALPTSWYNYAERVYFCSFVLKSNQACPKYSLGFSVPLPKRRFHIFHIEPLPSAASSFFSSLELSWASTKDKLYFNRFWKASSHVIFLLQRKLFLFLLLPPSPKGTCSFNEPWCSLLN